MTRHRSVLLAPVLLAVALATTAGAAHPPDARTAAGTATGTAGTDDRATVSAVLDGRPVEDLDAGDPLVLRADRDLQVQLEITNDSTEDLRLRAARLQGRVLGVPFLNYSTRVELVVEPGETVGMSYEVDVSELNESAVGLLPAQLVVVDDQREPIAEPVELVVDARGSLTSAYGLFGILVAVMTALLLGAALVRLARGTLPENRWYRAVRFAVPAAGLGLTATVTLSVFRVLVPDTGSWLTIVVVCALVGLVLGFLTPSPRPAWSQRDAEPPPRRARRQAPVDEATTVDALGIGRPEGGAEVSPGGAVATGRSPSQAPVPDEPLPGPRTAAER